MKPASRLRRVTGFSVLAGSGLGLMFLTALGLLAQYDDRKVTPPPWLAGYRIRYPLRVVGEGIKTNRSQSVVARLPTGGWLRPDGGDVVVQAQNGAAVPTAVVSHHANGDTLIQFKRVGDALDYWAYAVNPGAPGAAASVAPEGIYAEFREWKGDIIENWNSIYGGLKKSDNVTGNAWVPYVAQNESPVRPDNPRNFATSYRGYLNIVSNGYYRFMVNADDASFIFLNNGKENFKLFERSGSNVRMKGRVDTNLWAAIDLTAGTYPIEVHQVCGNNPASEGYCTLLWMPPGAKGPGIVPIEAFAQPLLAEVAGVEDSGGGQACTFAFGVDDSLSSEGVNLYLARFEAQGSIRDPKSLQWTFGDGATATGTNTVEHVYFKPGEYKVSLKSSPTMAPFTKTVYVWPGVPHTSPASLSIATDLLKKADWTGWDVARINTMFDFLLICEQPNRWPLVEKLAQALLAKPGADPKRRALYYTSLMHALAEQSRWDDSLKLMDTALTEFAKLPSLQAEILMAGADVNWRNKKDFKEASRLYEKLINEHKGLSIPLIRQAAIHWGDLFTAAERMPEAAERYRLAGTLGGIAFAKTPGNEAIETGTLLRVAEQKLRSGDVRAGRKLLEDIEMKFPEQKLQGLYRFLRAEADRHAGRYDEAENNYRVLVKLNQWAGFRDRAFFGIADCYYRRENFEETLKLLEIIKEKYNDFWKSNSLDDYQKVVKGRRDRMAAAKAEAAGGGAKEDAADIGFKGFVTGFEPGDASPGRPERFKFTPMLGMMGPTVGFMQGLPAMNNFAYYKRLRNMMARGNYWVEFWYRELDGIGSVTWASAFNITLQGQGGVFDADGGSAVIPIDRTYGQWRKIGIKLKAPVSQDGLLKVDFTGVYGVLELDGVRILPVSDRENDSLRSFFEGTTEPE